MGHLQNAEAAFQLLQDIFELQEKPLLANVESIPQAQFVHHSVAYLQQNVQLMALMEIARGVRAIAYQLQQLSITANDVDTNPNTSNDAGG